LAVSIVRASDHQINTSDKVSPADPFATTATDALIEIALAADPDGDDPLAWKATVALQSRLFELLERIPQWTESREEKRRRLAATVLGQCGIKMTLDADQCTTLLLKMLSTEDSAAVIADVISALGHLEDPRALGSVLHFHQHPESRVRFAVVYFLNGKSSDVAVSVLIERSSDGDRDVRDWAMFGLGSMINLDTPEIRAALAAGLDDVDDEVRGEALVGLSTRGDLRVVPALLKELNRHEPAILQGWTLIHDTAEQVMAHASRTPTGEWEPVVSRLKELGLVRSTPDENGLPVFNVPSSAEIIPSIRAGELFTKELP
jgi:HEAT repeat protein